MMLVERYYCRSHDNVKYGDYRLNNFQRNEDEKEHERLDKY